MSDLTSVWYPSPQVVSLGSEEGPAGVTVTLTPDANREQLRSQVTTGPGGKFTFSPVPAGDYEVRRSSCGDWGVNWYGWWINRMISPSPAMDRIGV